MIELAEKILEQIFPEAAMEMVSILPLQGDGSDRTWYRAISGNRSVIIVQPGMRKNTHKRSEASSYVAIARHLKQKQVPVPDIYYYDPVSEIIVMEDCGDIHLSDIIREENDYGVIAEHYHAIIDQLITMQINGNKGFNPNDCLETQRYDEEMILEREARYFVVEFLNRALGLSITFDDLAEEFRFIARKALQGQITGFLHRDFQSKNILVQDNKYRIIDFQSGRLGPVQYDLASLLIDPYAGLSEALQKNLLSYYVQQLARHCSFDAHAFEAAYEYNCLNRNFQILGAFSYLSIVQKKAWFRAYMPRAWEGLCARLYKTINNKCPILISLTRQWRNHGLS
ncbi:MAG: phosphotransferase [Pseudomonadota bacterium]